MPTIVNFKVTYYASTIAISSQNLQQLLQQALEQAVHQICLNAISYIIFKYFIWILVGLRVVLLKKQTLDLVQILALEVVADVAVVAVLSGSNQSVLNWIPERTRRIVRIHLRHQRNHLREPVKKYKTIYYKIVFCFFNSPQRSGSGLVGDIKFGFYNFYCIFAKGQTFYWTTT